MERKIYFKLILELHVYYLLVDFFFCMWNLFKQTKQKLNPNTSQKQWQMMTGKRCGWWPCCEPDTWTVCYLCVGQSWAERCVWAFATWCWLRGAPSSLAPSAVLCFLGTVVCWLLPGALHSFVECNCTSSPDLQCWINGRNENTMS